MSSTSQADAVIRRRATALAALSAGLAGVAVALLLLSDEPRISDDHLLWQRVDGSWVTDEPASFLSLLAVPIVVAALLVVLSGGNSPLLRKVAVVAGIAVAGVAAAFELDLVDPYDLAEQVHLGIVPACLLSLGLFGSALALGQASIRSTHR
jgi:hypothetical protein